MNTMARRPAALLLSLVVTAVAAVMLSSGENADAAASLSRTAQLRVDAPTVQRGFERWAAITRIKNGYYYDAGQQNTHLVVTRVKGGLRYTDRHTDVLRAKPKSCDRKRADKGLVVVCHVPRDVSARNPMRVKVFTRLGNDYVDTSALSAAFELYGLCDQGDDTYIGGDGNDFVNGAPGRDHVWGGPGNDLVRGGENHDLVYGGSGNDTVVGLDGPDLLRGGSGKDRVGGGYGDDRLYAGPDVDLMVCQTGFDRVYAQHEDRVIVQACERVFYS
jgi:hypothetical protein